MCNIGGAEVARRKKVAQAGGTLFIAYSVAVFVMGLSLTATAGAFLPAMIFAIGFVQSRKKFCLAYGLMGTFNFKELGSLSKVVDKQSIAADRKTALLIILRSTGVALALTLILAYASQL